METTQKLAPIMERIRKLLAMSKDVSSPHEAAIAAKRVQALLERHNLEESAVITMECNSGEGMDEVLAEGKTKTVVGWKGSLTWAVVHLFDCEGIWTNDEQGFKRVRLYGYKTDVQTALWTYEMLVDATNNATKRMTGLDRKGKNAFRQGFAAGVQKKVKEILVERRASQRSDSKALVLVKRDAIAKRFGSTSYSRKTTHTRNSWARNQGYEQGKSTNFNRPIEGARQRRLAG